MLFITMYISTYISTFIIKQFININAQGIFFSSELFAYAIFKYTLHLKFYNNIYANL